MSLPLRCLAACSCGPLLRSSPIRSQSSFGSGSIGSSKSLVRNLHKFELKVSSRRGRLKKLSKSDSPAWLPPPQKRFYEKLDDFRNKVILHKDDG